MRRPRARTLVIAGAAIVAVAASAVYLTRHRGGSAIDPLAVPTARVTRGSLDLSVHALGDLRASKTTTLSAPAVGGLLRLVMLAATGTDVRKGDVLMEFDPMEQQYTLEQSRSDLAEAEQTIIKTRADTDAQAAQDQVTLLTARFDLRRAELDAISDKELIAANDYAKRQLTLDEATRHLAQVEEDVKSRVATSAATLAVAEAKRTKAKLAADRAQQSIDSLVVKSPMDGIVVVRENRDASGGFGYSGMSLPEFRAGDNVYPGRPVVGVFDISHMEIRSQVNEQERNNVSEGQSATVESDALPGGPIPAKVTAVAGMTGGYDDFFGSSGPLREFDVTLALDRVAPGIRPGTTVRLLMAGKRVDNVLHIPRQAVFEKNGKPIVYVRHGDRFEIQQVKPVHRTENRIAIEGLAEGAEVALVNPDTVLTAQSKKGSSSSVGAEIKK
jgi:multidrug resistance efflux pump